MPPQSPSPPPSKPQSTNILTRALLTTPFLLLSAAAFLHMDILGMMRRPSPSATGKITWDSGSVDILPRFHYLSFLDDIYRDVTVGFAPSAFGYDPVSWWQAFVFLQDVGLLHCVWLLESSREGVWESGGRGVWFATLWSTLAQTGGGGIIIPLYFFTHLISSRPALSTRTAGPRINLNDIYLYIPLLLIFHTIPALAMYLTPSLDNRQWWIWFWQMYPCRVSLGYYILTTLRRLFFGKAREEGRRATRSESLLSAEQYHGALGMWLAPLLLASTAAWLYTLFCAPYSLSTIFLPARLSPELEGSFVGLMRRLLQWDQCYVTGAAFFWVAYLMGDLWMAGKVSRGQVLKFVGLVGLVPILGPGAGFLVMWLVRERYLVSGSGEKVSKGN